MSHIDVLIFNDTDEKTKVWSDRVNASANETGRITLPVKRSSFTENERYWVYLIANSTHPEKDFENLANLNALKAMTQEDENIHLTGKDIEGVPGTFLMDGIAYPEGNDEPRVLLRSSSTTARKGMTRGWRSRAPGQRQKSW